MYEIPAGVTNPAFMREPNSISPEGKFQHGVPFYRIVDLSHAKALCKQRLARHCGTIRRKICDGNKKTKPELPVFELKRDSGSLLSMTGESASMRPSAPSHGAVGSSGYARRLDGFVSNNREARNLFRAWKTKRHKDGVSQEVFNMLPERAILYFPGAGKLTCRGVDVDNTTPSEAV